MLCYFGVFWIFDLLGFCIAWFCELLVSFFCLNPCGLAMIGILEYGDFPACLGIGFRHMSQKGHGRLSLVRSVFFKLTIDSSWDLDRR